MTTLTRANPDPDVVHTPLPNGETVILHLRTKRYYSLNGTGSRIWQRLAEGRTIDDVVRDLEQVFDVTAEDARRSVQQLVESLVTESLIVPV